MYVQKRNGHTERVQFDKISSRISKLAYGLNPDFVDPVVITQKVIKGVYSGVTTAQLDTLAAETAAYLTTEHPDYSTLAARIAVSNLHKQTESSFSSVVHNLFHCVDASSGRPAPLIADDVYAIVMEHREELDSRIVYDRDYSYDYFGFKTLERSYLLKINGAIAERPQHMPMRVSVGIHKRDVAAALEMYDRAGRPTITNPPTGRGARARAPVVRIARLRLALAAGDHGSRAIAASRKAASMPGTSLRILRSTRGSGKMGHGTNSTSYAR